jgi:predicted outer membrane lipoprotein
MDIWVFTAVLIIYLSVAFGIVYGLWPQKDEDEEEEA